MNTRLLGALGMIGSVGLLLEGLLTGFQQQADSPLVGAVELLYIGGWMCSVAGLYRLNATGSRAAGKALLIIQLVGLALAAGFALFAFAPSASRDGLLYNLMDAAWPLSHLFMIVVGIAALRAKRLTGWRRIAPLLCGLALPLFMAATVAAGEGAGRYLFPIFTLVAFALLGYAVRSTEGAGAAGRTAPALEAKAL